MKFKSDLCVLTATGFLLLYANYFAIMNMFMPGMIKDIYLAFFTVLGLVPFFFRQRKLAKRQIMLLIPWFLLLCEIMFNRNQDLANGFIQFFVRTIAGVSIIFMSQYGLHWQKYSLREMGGIGAPNVIATYVFLFVPSLYKIMIRIYGSAPVGTSGGSAGYRAGLANHYSQNGTLIAFVLLVVGSCLLYYVTEAKVMNYPCLIATLLSFAAIVLTSKRAHFLFTIAAFCVVYFIANPKQILGRGFKLFAAVVLGLIALYLMSFQVSAIRTLLQRFMTAGQDSQMRTRFKMWGLALELFRKNPVMGIGWGGYKHVYAVELYQDWQSAGAKYLNSHNTYLQLLAETGIVGFAIYLWATLGTFFATAKALMKKRSIEPWKRRVLYTSVVCQVFVLFYNFTGNTLYDYTIFMYSFAVMAGLGVIRSEYSSERITEEDPEADHSGSSLQTQQFAGEPIMESE